jgi:hypothetical protein
MIHKRLVVLLVCVHAGLLSLIVQGSGRQPPATLEEVRRRALQRGLYCGVDTPNGTLTYRLIVSKRPLTFERINNLRFGMPFDPCWNGTVAVSYPARSWAIEYRISEPSRSGRWGTMFLFGDPEVMHTLTGQHVTVRWRPAQWFWQ